MKYIFKQTKKEHICDECGRLIKVGEMAHKLNEKGLIKIICNKCYPISSNIYNYRCYTTLMDEENK